MEETMDCRFINRTVIWGFGQSFISVKLHAVVGIPTIPTLARGKQQFQALRVILGYRTSWGQPVQYASTPLNTDL